MVRRSPEGSNARYLRCIESIIPYPNFPRQFDPIEASAEQEKKNALALLSRMESDTKKMRGGPSTNDDGLVNVRKAIRLTSKRQGSVAFARKLDDSKNSKKSKR